MELVNIGFSFTKNTVNNLFGVHSEPWQVATLTTSSILTSVWLWNFLFQDESKLITIYYLKLFKIKLPSFKVILEKQIFF